MIHQVALLLIRERSRLVAKLLETRKHNAELEQQLAEERDRVQSVSVELDRQFAECEQLCSRLSCAESLNRSLQAELSQLQSVPQTTAAVAAGLNRPTQSPRIAVSTTPAPDLHPRPVSETVSYFYLKCWVVCQSCKPPVVVLSIPPRACYLCCSWLFWYLAVKHDFGLGLAVIITIIPRSVFTVLSSWPKVIARVHWIMRWMQKNARWLPIFGPSRPTWAISPLIGSWETTSTVAIYYYSARKLTLILPPPEGRRLSQPRWLVTYPDDLPACKQSPI